MSISNLSGLLSSLTQSQQTQQSSSIAKGPAGLPADTNKLVDALKLAGGADQKATKQELQDTLGKTSSQGQLLQILDQIFSLFGAGSLLDGQIQKNMDQKKSLETLQKIFTQLDAADGSTNGSISEANVRQVAARDGKPADVSRRDVFQRPGSTTGTSTSGTTAGLTELLSSLGLSGQQGTGSASNSNSDLLALLYQQAKVSVKITA